MHRASTFDAENRLVASTVAGVNASYAYNGDGLRISRTEAGVATTYVWDVASGLPKILQDSAGNRYVYGLDRISRVSGTTEEFYLYDGLGSTTGLADGAGAVSGSRTYDVFGAIRSKTGTSPTEFTFAGQQVDSSGLQYLRARYYDRNTGRFISKDPLASGSTASVHPFVYANSNSVNQTDPSGLDPGDEPTPVPVPGANSAAGAKRCVKGFEECVNELAYVGGRKGQFYYRQVCTDYLRICFREVASGGRGVKFDRDGAKKRMEQMFRSAHQGRSNWISDVLDRIKLPATGSGGFLESPQMEGRFDCSP